MFICMIVGNKGTQIEEHAPPPSLSIGWLGMHYAGHQVPLHADEG